MNSTSDEEPQIFPLKLAEEKLSWDYISDHPLSREQTPAVSNLSCSETGLPSAHLLHTHPHTVCLPPLLLTLWLWKFSCSPGAGWCQGPAP